MTKLVLLRHGESVWNKENRFTGWTDVDLSDKGVDEARKAGVDAPINETLTHLVRGMEDGMGLQ